MNTETAQVLVIEDEEKAYKFYQRVLEKSGFSVSWAATSELAIKFAFQQKFDIAIVDLRLGGEMDGLMTYRVLKTVQPQMKGIVITGHTNLDSLNEAVKVGVSEWLTKPVGINDLLCAVQKILSVSETSRSDILPVHLSSSVDLTSRFPTEAGLNAIFRLVLQIIATVTVSNIGVLWVVGQDEKTMSPLASVGLANIQLPDHIPYSKNDWFQCLKKLMRDVSRTLCLIVPIKYNENLIGALSVGRKLTLESFYNEVDLLYLERFAKWLAPFLFVCRHQVSFVEKTFQTIEIVQVLLQNLVNPSVAESKQFAQHWIEPKALSDRPSHLPALEDISQSLEEETSAM